MILSDFSLKSYPLSHQMHEISWNFQACDLQKAGGMTLNYITNFEMQESLEN